MPAINTAAAHAGAEAVVADGGQSPLTPTQRARANHYLQMAGLPPLPDMPASTAATTQLTAQLRNEDRQRVAGRRLEAVQHGIADNNRLQRQKIAQARPADAPTDEAVLTAVVEQAEHEILHAARPAWMPTDEELDASERDCADREARAAAKRAALIARAKVQRQPVPPLADLLDLDQFRPKRGRGAGTAGAGALAELLDSLARTRLATRLHLYNKAGYPPRQIVLHLSAELLAAALGVSDNTLRAWTGQLQAVGYLRAKPHYTTTTLEGERVTAVDGMLYAVRLSAGHEARLRWADYKRKYRDLDADRAEGRTAYNAIRNAERRAREWVEENDVLDEEKNIEGSSILLRESNVLELREQLRRWAVIPGNVTTENPLTTDSAIISPEEVAERLNSVQDVVYMLPILANAHHSKRAALVGIMGAALARALDDQHSRAWYCKVIWEAWQDEVAGRKGLQALAGRLECLEVDRREWSGLRRPAALFAARERDQKAA